MRSVCEERPKGGDGTARHGDPKGVGGDAIRSLPDSPVYRRLHCVRCGEPRGGSRRGSTRAPGALSPEHPALLPSAPFPNAPRIPCFSSSSSSSSSVLAAELVLGPPPPDVALLRRSRTLALPGPRCPRGLLLTRLRRSFRGRRGWFLDRSLVYPPFSYFLWIFYGFVVVDNLWERDQADARKDYVPASLA